MTVRTRIFEVNETADIAFSRIDWRIEKVKRLVSPVLNLSTADTAKPWVGKIDREKKEFKMIQTAPYFSPRLLEGNFFQLYVHGQIFDEGHKSRVSLRFIPGFHTTLFFLLVYMVPIIVTVTSFRQGDNDSKGLVLGLLITIVFTLLFIFQLNKTENKLIDLFET